MSTNRNPHSGARARVAPKALISILAAVLAVPLLASTLDVQNTNVNDGIYAARVGVGTTCADPTHVTVSDPVVPATFTACSSVTSDADIPSGTTRFTAGDLVKLRSGFSVDSGADFVVEIDRTLYPDAWVQDDTPDGEKVYAARFYNDPAALVLEGAERFYHFIAFDAAGDPEARVGVKRNGTERRLFLEVFLDNGSVASTETTNEILLPGDGNFHFVEMGWTASTGPGSNNGSAYICLDQAAPPTGCVPLATLDNDTGAIDFVRWGAVDVPSNSDIGNLDLDDFESRSSLNIGPLPP